MFWEQTNRFWIPPKKTIYTLPDQVQISSIGIVVKSLQLDSSCHEFDSDLTRVGFDIHGFNCSARLKARFHEWASESLLIFGSRASESGLASGSRARQTSEYNPLKPLYNPLTWQGLRREHQEIVDKLRMLVAYRDATCLGKYGASISK